jgi:hypothetical protein
LINETKRQANFKGFKRLGAQINTTIILLKWNFIYFYVYEIKQHIFQSLVTSEGMVHCAGISWRAICALGGFLSKKIGRHGFGCKKSKNLTLGPNPKTSGKIPVIQ